MIEQPAWGVWCEVWGGVTGPREGWLKDAGKPARYTQRQDAQRDAERLERDRMGNPYRSASYRYMPREID